MRSRERTEMDEEKQKWANFVIRHARDAARDESNPDTCGVCHMHLQECEAEVSTHMHEDDDPPCWCNHETFPSCAGGRIRAALKAYDDSYPQEFPLF